MDLARKLKAVTDEALRLMAIVEVGKLLNSTLDLDRVLGIILDTAVKNLDADRGTVYLIDHQKGELWSKVLQGENIVEIRLPLGQGIAGYVGQTGKRLMLKDAYKDSRFNPEFDKRTGYRTRTVLCTPMKDRNGRMIGVFQIFNKKEGYFSLDDVKFLDTLSVDACIAIENARLHEEALEKQRMEKELEVAAAIQQMILPKTIEQVDGCRIDGMNIPSRQVGGDYYDVIHLPGGEIALVIADVSGKSVSGALLVSILQASLRAYLEGTFDLARLVAKLNKTILKNSTSDKFITFFIAVYNPSTRALRSVNAGHNPPLLRRGRQLIKVEGGGIPLGMIEFEGYSCVEQTLEKGDTLVMFTDGVTEAANPEDEFYGDQRLEQLVMEHGNKAPSELKRLIHKDVERYVNGAEQSDDVTLLVLSVD